MARYLHLYVLRPKVDLKSQHSVVCNTEFAFLWGENVLEHFDCPDKRLHLAPNAPYLRAEPSPHGFALVMSKDDEGMEEHFEDNNGNRWPVLPVKAFANLAIDDDCDYRWSPIKAFMAVLAEIDPETPVVLDLDYFAFSS